MDLKPTFKFAPKTALAPRSTAVTQTLTIEPGGVGAGEPAAAASDLGLLDILLNQGDKVATWEGGGFNMIWRPHFDPTPGGTDHFLELNRTHETIIFSRIPGPIPNRGLLQEFIQMFGVNYLSQISDVNVLGDDGSGVGLHFEPGIWAIVPATSHPLEPPTVVRMASIPHGTAIVAQGTIDRTLTPGPPQIGVASITPFAINAPAQLVPFLSESNLANNSEFTTPASDRQGITQEMVDNPNSLLVAMLADVKVLETTTIRISTLPTPVPGGGTANTAFLSGVPGVTPDTNANARAAAATATIWIMKVETAAGAIQTWLQYTQTVLLNFNTLSWPHVTVGSLVLQPPEPQTT
ncbi:MAG: hypothetical protein IAI50_16155 [Candidatus Eremiobacteraeota bacterium]|nr:hypothetical protein [Candidatus Eremiobacteraeota bacterium]